MRRWSPLGPEHKYVQTCVNKYEQTCVPCDPCDPCDRVAPLLAVSRPVFLGLSSSQSVTGVCEFLLDDNFRLACPTRHAIIAPRRGAVSTRGTGPRVAPLAWVRAA